MPPFLTPSEPEPDLGWADGGGRSVVEETRHQLAWHWQQTRRQAATGALPVQSASQSQAATRRKRHARLSKPPVALAAGRLRLRPLPHYSSPRHPYHRPRPATPRCIASSAAKLLGQPRCSCRLGMAGLHLCRMPASRSTPTSAWCGQQTVQWSQWCHCPQHGCFDRLAGACA